MKMTLLLAGLVTVLHGQVWWYFITDGHSNAQIGRAYFEWLAGNQYCLRIVTVRKPHRIERSCVVMIDR